MSGGRLNYAYDKISQAAEDLRFQAGTPLQRAMVRHLDLVSKAMHDIEWVLSGDYGEGDDEAAIRAVLGEHAELIEAIKEAFEVKEALEAAIAKSLLRESVA